MAKKSLEVKEVVMTKEEVSLSIVASTHLQKAMKEVGKTLNVLSSDHANKFIVHYRNIITTKDPEKRYRSALYATIQDLVDESSRVWRRRLLIATDKAISPKK